jgi:hypothetical protein
MSPLPDAPPTDKSRVYREFASKTALPVSSGTITSDLIDNFKNSLYLDEFSEDELRRLLLIQSVTGTGSSSGPFPASGAISEATITGSGSGGAQNVVIPEPGEVLLLGAGDAYWNTSPGSSITFSYYIINTSDSNIVLADTFSSSSTNPSLASLFQNMYPQYITYPFAAQFRVSSMGSAAECVVSIYSTRVR